MKASAGRFECTIHLRTSPASYQPPTASAALPLSDRRASSRWVGPRSSFSNGPERQLWTKLRSSAGSQPKAPSEMANW